MSGLSGLSGRRGPKPQLQAKDGNCVTGPSTQANVERKEVM